MGDSEERIYEKKLRENINAGNIQAMYELGLYYCEVGKIKKSKNLIILAAKKGCVDAIDLLKLLQDKGIRKMVLTDTDANNISMLKSIEARQAEIDLTNRQASILKLILHGKTSKQIAKEINLSFRTVEDHTNRLKRKFNCSYKKELFSILHEKNCEI